LSPPEASASIARKFVAAAAAVATTANRSGKIKRSGAPATPLEPPRTDRFSQLCALAADPNQDVAECARADLFHELPEECGDPA
jgi:hypothetical protein